MNSAWRLAERITLFLLLFHMGLASPRPRSVPHPHHRSTPRQQPAAALWQGSGLRPLQSIATAPPFHVRDTSGTSAPVPPLLTHSGHALLPSLSDCLLPGVYWFSPQIRCAGQTPGWRRTNQQQRLEGTTAPENPVTRQSLMDFYISTSGEKWDTKTNWASNQSYCEWYGITCGRGTRDVTSL